MPTHSTTGGSTSSSPPSGGSGGGGYPSPPPSGPGFVGHQGGNGRGWLVILGILLILGAIVGGIWGYSKNATPPSQFSVTIDSKYGHAMLAEARGHGACIKLSDHATFCRAADGTEKVEFHKTSANTVTYDGSMGNGMVGIADSDLISEGEIDLGVLNLEGPVMKVISSAGGITVVTWQKPAVYQVQPNNNGLTLTFPSPMAQALGARGVNDEVVTDAPEAAPAPEPVAEEPPPAEPPADPGQAQTEPPPADPGTVAPPPEAPAPQ